MRGLNDVYFCAHFHLNTRTRPSVHVRALFKQRGAVTRLVRTDPDDQTRFNQNLIEATDGVY